MLRHLIKSPATSTIATKAIARFSSAIAKKAGEETTYVFTLAEHLHNDPEVFKKVQDILQKQGWKHQDTLADSDSIYEDYTKDKITLTLHSNIYTETSLSVRGPGGEQSLKSLEKSVNQQLSPQKGNVR